MVCKDCHSILTDHVENVEHEFDANLVNNRMQRIKVHQKNKGSPSKDKGVEHLLDQNKHYFGWDVNQLKSQLNNFLNHPFGSSIGGQYL